MVTYIIKASSVWPDPPAGQPSPDRQLISCILVASSSEPITRTGVLARMFWLSAGHNFGCPYIDPFQQIIQISPSAVIGLDTAGMEKLKRGLIFTISGISGTIEPQEQFQHHFITRPPIIENGRESMHRIAGQVPIRHYSTCQLLTSTQLCGGRFVIIALFSGP